MARKALIITGVAALVLTIGFFIQAPWATVLWPLQAGRLSYIFIASILAAAAVPVIWIGISGEMTAMLGGAINFGVAYTAFAIYAAQLYARERAPGLLMLALVSTGLALTCLAIFIFSLNQKNTDMRRTPTFVRISFGLFAIALFLVGGGLVLQRPNIFPWPISPETSVFYGWIFLGAMCYFIVGVFIPRWDHARGQLLGFLAYDLVLIVPFLLHFKTVRPDLLVNLVVYTGVLIYSGGLAVFTMFFHPATRFGAAPTSLKV